MGHITFKIFLRELLLRKLCGSEIYLRLWIHKLQTELIWVLIEGKSYTDFLFLKELSRIFDGPSFVLLANSQAIFFRNW